MIAQNEASLPGNNDLDAVAQWTAWLQGKVAMIYSWPPTGRISSNYAQRDKAINFIPKSEIADKVGYAVMPGGNGEMASGYVKALAAGSKNEEAAYLFMQWVTAPPLSMVRTMLPYTLRDPYRMSTYRSQQYRALWPAAKDYLSNLCEAANTGVVDMIMPGWQDYALTIDRMCTAVWGGQAPKRRSNRPTRSGTRPPSVLASTRKRPPMSSSSRYPGRTPTTRSKSSVWRCTSPEGSTVSRAARAPSRGPQSSRRAGARISPSPAAAAVDSTAVPPARSRAAPYRNGSIGTSNG